MKTSKTSVGLACSMCPWTATVAATVLHDTPKGMATVDTEPVQKHFCKNGHGISARVDMTLTEPFSVAIAWE